MGDSIYFDSDSGRCVLSSSGEVTVFDEEVTNAIMGAMLHLKSEGRMWIDVDGNETVRLGDVRDVLMLLSDMSNGITIGIYGE